ncbi:amidohydrolase [Photobacterium atrarenae]|uniref:Amidohydrolase n=1 Tax=Photobacterium atrarenae TaxID=865757 RepID=A0ABY5GK92_9GAMM|nr:amidohydrolase [Photobacterium atrarenae]UTV29657.1 amidohydrolase [Photobacterium atrarenae]
MRPAHFLAITSILCSTPLMAAEPADVIIANAQIYGYPDADTLAIDDSKIVFVGQASEGRRYQAPATQLIDAGQAFVMPGFIDNHNHVFEAASEVGGNCELSAEASLAEQVPHLKACRQQANSRSWLMGYGFSLDAILDDENQDTPLAVIDRIFPDQPVVIMEQTSHSMWVNSEALKRAGLSSRSPEPQGGKILKDEATGELNGILLDNAGDIVMELAWNSMERPFQQSYDGLMAGLEEAAAHGITTIGDGRLYWKRGWYEVWQQAAQDGTLTARVSLRPWIYPTEPMASQLAFLKSIQSGNHNRLLWADQVKMYSDGIFINGTAKTLAPYRDTYIPDEPYGINYIPPQQMKTWLNALDQIGYSAHIHAIGDGAIRESLNAIDHVRHQGSKRPYTLTHVELISPKDIPRFAELNVTADFQVGSDYIAHHDHQWAEAFLGARRTRALMNLNAIYATGANVTLSSDWNVHDINPLLGIANSLKMGSTGLPDIHAAIDAYTINAAKSLGISDITGSLEIGKSADLVFLAQDITRLPIDAIPETPILMTVLQGDIIYDAER